MGFTSRDMYAEVNIDLLHRAVRRSQLSYQAIADGATDELRKIARRERQKRRGGDVPGGVSKALVGQLMTGDADTTHELRAIAIERTLGVSEGDIFTPTVVHGVGTTQRMRKRAG